MPFIRIDKYEIRFAIPELADIHKLAIVLHERGLPYDDKVWDWPVYYTPSTPEPPIDSQMSFTPAGFFIGVWPIWYISSLWENGDNAAPSLSIGDELIKKEI